VTISQVQGLVGRIFPRREFDAQAVLELVASWPQRNRAADRSHRKRRIAEINELREVSL
jgi:hypothetical protein